MTVHDDSRRERREFGTLRLRGKIWWLRYKIDGKTHEESSGSTSKRLAEKSLAQREAEHRTGNLTAPDAKRVRFADLRKMILDDYAVNARRSTNRLLLSLRHLEAYFGNAKALSITADRVTANEVERLTVGAKRATVNCELAALRRMFRLAIQKNRLPASAMPHIVTPNPRNARKGFFEPADWVALLAELPDYLQPPMQFAYCTGWRIRDEVLALTWDRVDFAEGVVRLDPNETKNDAGRTFPFRALPALEELLRRQREVVSAFEREQGTRIPYVFVGATGSQVRDHYGAWRSACKRASTGASRGAISLLDHPNLVGRIAHDFRRSAVRNLTRAGVPEGIAMKITGHKTRAVFDRYDIVNEADLAQNVARLASYLGRTDGVDTKRGNAEGTDGGQSSLRRISGRA